jgi:hypothetical protein
MNESKSNPVYYECGICGYYHPIDWKGSCLDNENRFSYDELNDNYGIDGWDRKYMT